jgi:two-component system, NarL family, sensor kinase
MKNLKISAKLFLSHIALGLFVLAALSIIFYSLLSAALIERTLDQLSSINILKKGLIENYLFRSQQNLEALQVEHKFLKIYHDLTKKPLPLSDNHDLTDIENLCKLYNFKNLHLFDTHHRQLYSTDKEMYPEGLLTRIDSAISLHPERLHIIDGSHHSPGYEPLLFYHLPILENDSVVGVVLVQENFQKIQSILRETTGMGNTGESYIVGHDKRMRSTSRFFPDSLPGKIQVDTEPVRNSFQGMPGRGITTDYRNVSVLSVYRNIENKDLMWAIISEMDENEAMEPIRHLRNYLLIIALSVMILTIAITYFLSTSIVRPVLFLKEIILTLSKGIIPTQKPLKISIDEIGEMNEAIQQLTKGFERTAQFANKIGSGNFNASFTTLSDQDVLGKALIRMQEELRGFHEKELKSVRARASALMEGQENERRRIIKELHDGVGQMLTAVYMQVDLLESDDERKPEIKKQINEALAEVKRISYDVMPQAIVDFGLEAALKGLCDAVKKYSPLVIDFQYISEIQHRLDFEISIALFRIAQEGLNNIVKHSGALHVNVHLVDKEDEVYFILEDDGKGFNESERMHAGSGLRNIRERAMLLNGTAQIHSAPGKGTSVEIHIPKA